MGRLLRARTRPGPIPLAGQGTAAVALAAIVAWNLWSLRVVTEPVSYLNDAAVHEQMTRFATDLINAGKLPFTSWFPLIGLGSAQYMRYQSLGSVLVGLAGTVFGAATSFRWSIYLLVSAWPVVVYSSARLFGLRRRVAIAAALLSPFVVSYTGIAYERNATCGSAAPKCGRNYWDPGRCPSPGLPRGEP